MFLTLVEGITMAMNTLVTSSWQVVHPKA